MKRVFGAVLAVFLSSAPTPSIAQDAAAAPAPAQPVPRFDVDSIDVAGNTLLSDVEIERAIYPHIGPGRTVDDIEAARAALQSAYEAKGYQSVFVEIPQQEASANIRLQVTEAKLGEVRVTGTRFYSADRIVAQVPALTRGTVPDLNATQAQITEANRLAGRQITPLLKPGKQPGTVDVELKVTEETPYSASLALSNDHSANTDPLRLTASVSYANLWGLGHTVSGTYVVAPQDRSDTEVFAGSYLAPIWGSPWSILLFGYKSNSNIAALGGTNVLGNGYSIGARAILALPSSSGFSQSLNFGLDYKNFDEDIVVGSERIRSPIRYAPLTVAYSAALSGDRSTLNVSLAATAGLRLFLDRDCTRYEIPDDGDNDPATTALPICSNSDDQFNVKRFGARENFVHLNLDADYTRTLGSDLVAALRFSGQLADGPLVSNEQFAAGGLGSVRGFLQSVAVGDDGVVGSAELRSPSMASGFGSWLDELRVYVFTDAGYARVKDAGAEQIDSFTLWSAGVGGRFALLGRLSGEVAVGYPIKGGGRPRDPYASFSVKAEY
jgi:hemolysin activation/secretion protein